MTFNPNIEKQITLNLRTGRPKKEGYYLVIINHYPTNTSFSSYEQFKEFTPYNEFDMLGWGKPTTFETKNSWYNLTDDELCVETPDFWCELPDISLPKLPKKYKILGEKLKEDERILLEKKLLKLG